MSREAKLILSLLVVASLNVSTVTSVLFFGRRSYENASYVQVICPGLPPDEKGRDRCEVSSVHAKIPHNDCTVELNVGSRALGPDSMEVVRFGDDKAILSWRVEESSGDQPVAASWRRLGVVHLKDSMDCELHELELTYGDKKYVPVSVVVNKNSFTVVVFNEEPDSQCRIPDLDIDVPRCAMDFDERGRLVGEPHVWFYQTKRDDDMILEPLDYENPESGYLLVDTVARPFSISVSVHIVKSNRMTLRLENFELNLTTSPYDYVAYSTANRLIGICVVNLLGSQEPRYRLICKQFDRHGKQTLEKSLQVERKNKYTVMNLAGGGLLLLSYSCRDPDNLCNLVDSITISVSRIESNGKVTPEFYRKNELYTCNKKYYRGEAQLFQLDSGHYCYTHVCIGYPKNQTDTDGPVIYTTCLPDENIALTPKIHPNDENADGPKGTVYFDPRSYKNHTWTTVFCSDTIHRDDGQTLCEVSRYRDQRLERTCEVWLYKRDLKPDAIEVLPLSDDNVILWHENKRARILQILHYEKCVVFQVEWAYHDCQCYPMNIITYDFCIAVVTKYNSSGQCKNVWQNEHNSSLCKQLLTAKGEIMTVSPLSWIVQEERKDDMTLEPLENGNPDGRHLLIETSDPKISPNSPVFVRASIVQENDKLLELGSYKLWDGHRDKPHDGIAYSTANDLIGICVRSESKSIVCEQFDLKGNRKLGMIVNRGYYINVINLPEPGPMLMIHYELFNSSLLVAFPSINGISQDGLKKSSTEIDQKCDSRSNRAAAKLFIHEVTGQYCYAKFCYRDSVKNKTDGNYMPQVVSTCLSWRKSKIYSGDSILIESTWWLVAVRMFAAGVGIGFMIGASFLIIKYTFKHFRARSTREPINIEMNYFF